MSYLFYGFYFLPIERTEKLRVASGKRQEPFGCSAETASAARLRHRHGKAPTEMQQQGHTSRAGDSQAASAFSWTTEDTGSSADIEEVLGTPWTVDFSHN